MQINVGERKAWTDSRPDPLDLWQAPTALLELARDQLLDPVHAGARHEAEYRRRANGDGGLFSGREVQGENEAGKDDRHNRQQGQAGTRQ
ncbi:hypothetical protein G6F24_015347 [Rhizopus arrhizus]|nr:hypothetical protein G6F24_015347 [Rhizopus arrhizus]